MKKTSVCLLMFLVGILSLVWSECPDVCTCRDDSHLYTEGTVTNCSFISNKTLESILANISYQTNKLYLDHVEIGNYIHKWPFFPVLSQLYVRWAGLTDISTFLSNIHNRTNSFILLDLSGNKIKSLDSTAFKVLPRLETLVLEHNDIRHLSSQTFKHLPNLLYLYLSFNKIAIIEDNTFSDLSKLIVLELSSNKLHWAKRKMNVFNGLISLVELKIQNNYISDLNKDVFQQTKKLQYIFLDNNQLTLIPISSFHTLPKLTALYITNNLISHIPEELSDLRYLQYLYLTGNRITEIQSEALSGLESLKHIWLNKNNISALSVDLAPMFYQVNEINLLENPWRCDCHLVWLVRWFKQKGDSHSPVCVSPHADLTWVNISLDTMRCPIRHDCKYNPSCTYCPPFQQLSEQGTCTCMAGHQQLQDSISCVACPIGSYSSGISKCEKCPNNAVGLSVASKSCTCLPGFTMNKNNQCSECPINSFKAKIGSYACFPCPLHSMSPVGSNSSTLCECENPSKKIHDYGTEECFSPIASSTRIYMPTEYDLPIATNNEKIIQGHVLVGVAMLCCVVMVTGVLVVYVRRYGSRVSRRKNTREGVSETFTLSSSDWINGFTISKDGRYSAWNVPIKKLKLGRLLGKGAFGIVNEANAYGGSSFDHKMFKVAVKRLRDSASEDDICSLKQELEQMKLLGTHANIISLYGFCQHKGQIMIIMELAELGDLLTHLKERASKSHSYVCISPDGNISEEETKQITEDKELMAFVWQVAKGMGHMENLKCIHRDLAARNVLLTDGPIAKISDFGLSRDVYENGYYLRVTKGRLPYKWLSPEALLWGQFSSKGDVWSYGMLLWEVATLGASPYPGIPAEAMAELHRSGYRMPKPPNCPDELYNVMRICWHEDPRNRPTFAKLCELMEGILLGAVNRNYLEIQPNPVYNNELYSDYSDSELMFSTLNSEETSPCLQTDNKYDGSSGYITSSLYS